MEKEIALIEKYGVNLELIEILGGLEHQTIDRLDLFSDDDEMPEWGEEKLGLKKKLKYVRKLRNRYYRQNEKIKIKL